MLNESKVVTSTKLPRKSSVNLDNIGKGSKNAQKHHSENLRKSSVYKLLQI